MFGVWPPETEVALSSATSRRMHLREMRIRRGPVPFSIRFAPIVTPEGERVAPAKVTFLLGVARARALARRLNC